MMQGFRRTVILSCALALVSACGGGGGEAGPAAPAPAPVPPTPTGSFTISSATLDFAGKTTSATLPVQSLAIHLLDTAPAALGAAYVAPQVAPGWLNVALAGTAPDYTGTFTVTTSGLAAGDYSAVVTLGTANASGTVLQSKPVQVNLKVVNPLLVVTPASILIGGLDGTDAAQGALQLTSGNPSLTTTWTASASTTSGGAWLSLGALAGTVGAGGTSLGVNADRSIVVPGRYSGTVTVQGQAGSLSDAYIIPVTFNREAHRLQASELGVGLSRFPSRSTLSRTINVWSSFGRTDVAWTASSDAAWLTATQGGVTGGSLTVTANPAGLAERQVHVARVTVRSSDPTIVNTQVIRIALWIDSTSDPGVTVVGSHENLVLANPAEPYVYASSRGSSLRVYNVYSGALVSTFTVPGTTLYSVAVSPDGAQLFALDTLNYQIIQLDAFTGSEVRRFALAPSNLQGIVVARPAGYPVLIAADGSVFDIATGDRLRSPQGSSQFTGSVGKFAAHPNGRYVFFVTYFTGANPFARHSIGYTSLSSSPFTLATGYQIPANSSAAGGGHAVCLSGDGSLAFSAGSSRMEIHDSQTLALRASLPLNSGGTNAACASSGLLAATGSGPAFDGRNLWVLRPDGSILVNESLMPDPDNFDPQVEGLAVSSDATRIVATDAGTKLLFRGLPAP